jgi:site-specific recombinase XerD
MATVKAFIRTSTKRTDKVNVRFRLSAGREVQLFHKANDISVAPDQWDAKKETIKAREKFIYTDKEKEAFKEKIANRKTLIERLYSDEPNKEALTSEWLETAIDKVLNPDKYQLDVQAQTFFQTFDEFLEKRKMSDVRKKNFRVVKRVLNRFEFYTAKITKKNFALELDTITADTLRAFETFLKNEHTLCVEYPEIYEAVPESRTPQPRGQNTLNGIFTKLRTFYLWAIDEGKTQSNPFRLFQVDECTYGTPYYISIDERKLLYSKDYSNNSQLSTQRDIFVFQCLVGCRVGDLYKMTKANIINGAIEYIPRKTKEGRPVTVRVPLNATAKEILARYPDGVKLLPFISEQKYNIYIKEAFLLAGLTRMVTVINPLTREEEKRPLNEIASSHLARRCFVGNLYKQVKDPNLVGALSGHKEGSRAFARYREIDDEMKNDLVNLLE